MLDRFTPLHVTGDGNCGPRAVSLALFSTQSRHTYIRLMMAIEICQVLQYLAWDALTCAGWPQS